MGEAEAATAALPSEWEVSRLRDGDLITKRDTPSCSSQVANMTNQPYAGLSDKAKAGLASKFIVNWLGS